jgi:hypothetical protein
MQTGTTSSAPVLKQASPALHNAAAVKVNMQDWPEPYIYGVCTVLLVGKSPNIWSYTVYIYGHGQPYKHNLNTALERVTLFKLLKQADS